MQQSFPSAGSRWRRRCRIAAARPGGKWDAGVSPRDQIELTGEITGRDLDERVAKADVFVMPSLFEGYAMVLPEAVARGLPIVCTTGGAMVETVPDAAAIKVPPGDAQALSEALERVLGKQRVADEAFRCVLALC